jgi:hypothetical protein
MKQLMRAGLLVANTQLGGVNFRTEPVQVPMPQLNSIDALTFYVRILLTHKTQIGNFNRC